MYHLGKQFRTVKTKLLSSTTTTKEDKITTYTSSQHMILAECDKINLAWSEPWAWPLNTDTVSLEKCTIHASRPESRGQSTQKQRTDLNFCNCNHFPGTVHRNAKQNTVLVMPQKNVNWPKQGKYSSRQSRHSTNRHCVSTIFSFITI